MQPPKETYKPVYLDYVYKELLIFKDVEELPPVFHAVVKANLLFKKKLADFKEFVSCLSGDKCFAPWIWETEEILQQSENCLRDFAHKGITEQQFVDQHVALADRILELAKDRLYEGHWEYGVSSTVDRQFDDLTELCRRIWSKESKAWVTLAKAWNKIDIHLIVYNDEQV
ncbi:hypothetical protein [Acinetobacter terrae]|uniref:hypothetical protein n=1 Tax=Acinetobacter terrae TaxID=2731247 RepID=UPI0020776C54|nr:hypothetical protein [Acinetobacter terrae]